MFAFFFSILSRIDRPYCQPDASIDVAPETTQSAPGGVALSGGLMDGTNDVYYVKFISSPGEESAA
jgi:hypothetical protein